MATQRSAATVADIDLLDRIDVDDELDIDLLVDLFGPLQLSGATVDRHRR